MIIFSDNEVIVAMCFIGSILFVIGGFIFSKLSKSSKIVKRNVSFGLYLWGIVSMFLNAALLWRIRNGTFEISPETSDDILDSLDGVADYLDDGIERFFDNSLIYMVITGIGILILTTGLVYKKKKWAKVVILIGIFTIVSGLLQLLLRHTVY